MPLTPAGDSASSAPGPGSLSFDTSMKLLLRAQGGDADALNSLLKRYLPSLRRWASGRLPGWARDRLDTDDLIQESILAVLPHVESFQPRREGALRAYLRQALLNRIRTEIRRVERRPKRVDVDVNDERFGQPDPGLSPLEEAIGKEMVESYEAALGRLRAEDREAIVARLEMCCSFEQLAEVLDKPSPDAARMAFSRALLRLAGEMSHAPR